jgi:hypothetical protein
MAAEAAFVSNVYRYSGSVSGEIDFYLNGKLRWGIELLVGGDGIGEHLSRFRQLGSTFRCVSQTMLLSTSAVTKPGNQQGLLGILTESLQKR